MGMVQKRQRNKWGGRVRPVFNLPWKPVLLTSVCRVTLSIVIAHSSFILKSASGMYTDFSRSNKSLLGLLLAWTSVWPLQTSNSQSHPAPSRDVLVWWNLLHKRAQNLQLSLWTQYKCYCGPQRLIHYNEAIKFRNRLEDKKQQVITSSENSAMMDFNNFLWLHRVMSGDPRQDGVTGRWCQKCEREMIFIK